MDIELGVGTPTPFSNKIESMAEGTLNLRVKNGRKKNEECVKSPDRLLRGINRRRNSEEGGREYPSFK